MKTKCEHNEVTHVRIYRDSEEGLKDGGKSAWQCDKCQATFEVTIGGDE